MQRSGTIAVSNPSSMLAANLSSLDIVRFYLDRPKDLMKMFHKIGTKQMSSKEHKNGMYSIIMLIYSVLTSFRG